MAKSSAPAAASPSRLPSTRESRPALIGLAILLIVGGALGSAWLALQSGDRAYFLKVEQEVAQGASISADDLGQVSLPEGFAGGIPVSDKERIVGMSATTRLVPGTVLIDPMVSKEAGIGDQKTQLTVQAEASPFIRNLQPGAQLALGVGARDGTSKRSAVLAELVSVGSAEEGGLTGAGGSSIPIVVSIDVSCFGLVSQGIEDNSVIPGLIGSGFDGAVNATCRG